MGYNNHEMKQTSKNKKKKFKISYVKWNKWKTSKYIYILYMNLSFYFSTCFITHIYFFKINSEININVKMKQIKN